MQESESIGAKAVYEFEGFRVDPLNRILLRDGQVVPLTAKVFDLLLFLLKNNGRLVKKDDIMRWVWPQSYVEEGNLTRCVSSLRKALDETPKSHHYIVTVPGYGYKFAANLKVVEETSDSVPIAEQTVSTTIIDVIEKVWRGESVEDGNLTRNVSTLRRALGDDARDHKYIVTVQGHGYRFIADVAEVKAGDGPEVAEEKAPLSQIGEIPKPTVRAHRSILAVTRGRRTALALWILALSVLAGAAGYYLWSIKPFWAKGSQPTFSIENIKLRNLTTTGDVYAPVISPDGRYLAYCSGPKLCIRQMATGSIIEIPPPLPAHLWGMLQYWGVTFSADSSQIYFTIADDRENLTGTLFRVPVLGGHSQKILNHVNSGGHESPDGNHIVFVRADQGKGLCHLMISNTDGTNEQILSTIDMNSLYGSLDWSSDSASILCAFRLHTADGYIHYIGEIPTTGGAESRITPPRRERILSAHWLPDKSGLIMTAIDPETQLSQIYYVTLPGGEERRITNDLNNYRGVSIARDGRTMIAQVSNATTHLWSAPSSDPGRAVRLASSTKGSFQGVSWMPDNELVYDSYESGLMQICKMTGDGSHVQQFTTRLGHNSDPSVTPDGRFITFCSTRSGSNQIWRMNANGDDPMELTHSTLSMFKPQSSPDGNWVYYTTDVHGKWQVRKVPIAGGDEAVVEDGPVELWAISPDGKMLAFSFVDEQKKKTRIAVRRLDASEPFKYFDISPGISLQWTRDGRALSYVQPISGNANIWLQPLDGKPPRPLTALSADEWIATYAWSLDGKALAYTRINTTFDAALLELK